MVGVGVNGAHSMDYGHGEQDPRLPEKTVVSPGSERGVRQVKRAEALVRMENDRDGAERRSRGRKAVEIFNPLPLSPAKLP